MDAWSLLHPLLFAEFSFSVFISSLASSLATTTAAVSTLILASGPFLVDSMPFMPLSALECWADDVGSGGGGGGKGGVDIAGGRFKSRSMFMLRSLHDDTRDVLRLCIKRILAALRVTSLESGVHGRDICSICARSCSIEFTRDLAFDFCNC